MAGKYKKVMGEHKRGTLKSGSGKKVTKASQAKAIAASEEEKSREEEKGRGKSVNKRRKERRGTRGA